MDWASVITPEAEQLEPLWVFGYGSLMWNPGFSPAERAVAELSGYARGFCMRSIHHRGTPERPGLVLALDEKPGARCHGLAFRVPEAERARVLEELRARELISSAYLERVMPVRLADGREVKAVVYVIDRNHVQYCGGLPLEEQARIIARARGGRGPNTEYLFNTAAHLEELGIEDKELTWLAARVRAIAAV
ncbi:cation transport protein ChaC [Meinhardsimonia xiamenensis]|jgi:cation transport protein ChaC|uniref:glutathione-specific gamma-glutamylcyclotransferase n=1 Tax=Meinhardsimonia xiamenensis TaxID=990712 RepID=A0A1G8YTL1_9RHOB|nr:gamma-glutamylcyclotransferase [Meinhardsimonia xiamenensis]PRX37433.1 cation transport protein ChaC [Meinhardsimonia xiamenensis]SDK06131.1 cation transport protein ChaC [Meinhardsimonia xiamenensis]